MNNSNTYRAAASIEDLPLALTVAEVAQTLRVGKNTVYALVRCGQLRSIQIGERIRIPKEALGEYLAS